MDTILIFVPCVLYNESPGVLYGVVKELKEEHIKVYYVLGRSDTTNKTVKNVNCRAIGYYCKEHEPAKHVFKHCEWLVLGLRDCEFVLHEVSSNGSTLDMSKPCQTICMIYDYKNFVESEFLLNSENKDQIYGDHFRTLACTLRETSFNNTEVNSIFSHFLLNKITQKIFAMILLTVAFLLNFIEIIYPVLKYSTLGLHLQVFLKSLAWVLQSSMGKSKISVTVKNYIVASVVDVSLGMLLLYWIVAMTSSPSQLLLDSGEVVVRTLRELLQWLMGIPAGLKLNYAFNNMLGRFFLYHINLWWTFLVVARPLLEVTFQVFLCLGRLGLTFQASILADLLALVSFHIYCIYVYAARLYNLQVSGLVALWRLFLGRKHNPLRDRVDSCQYTTDQLFVGTLAFTILLFLLPTTVMYYIVFTTLRLVVVAMGGLLIRLRYILQCLPLYVTLLWILQSTTVSSTVHLTVPQRESSGPLVLSVRPVVGSWWRTVIYCMPEPLQPPPLVEWKNVMKNLASGRLIYPF